jgi:hypothetical protein
MATRTDDWFSEPSPAPTLNDLYTRRLAAWGWINLHGETLWDKAPVFHALHQVYVDSLRDMLNRPVLLLGPEHWTANPEAPADIRPTKGSIQMNASGTGWRNIRR